MNGTLLKIENLSCSFNEEKVLDNISFSLSEKISIGVIGPNGGGKSTLMNVLTGNLNKNNESKFYFKNNLVKKLDPRSDFSYLPQEKYFNTYFGLSVLEFIKMGQIGLKIKPIKIDEIIDIFDLSKLLKKDFSQLSGGQKQKVMLARVFLRNTPLIFLDEPTLGLDGKANDQLIQIISIMKNSFNFGIIIIDHHIDTLIEHCEQILCLNKNAHWHSPSEKVTSDQIQHFYHCEYEHLLVHNHQLATGTKAPHTECSTEHSHDDTTVTLDKSGLNKNKKDKLQ